LGLQEDKVEAVRSKVKNMIEVAHAKGVNILLFPELAVDLNYGQLLEDVSSLAKAYEMYIIPGSYHDQETKRNISAVVGPNGILWQQEKHIPATISYGGKKFKEGIEVGTLPRKTIVCNTEFGRIAIAICRDFLDMDLRVELKNFEPPVDIIFNPAFTPVTEDFKAAHFDARRSIYAYCFFANVAEFGDSHIYTPEKERLERTIPPREESLIYKDIDLFKLRSERKKWEKEQGKERPFIQSTR
jgi:predicted amidohydrolase